LEVADRLEITKKDAQGNSISEKKDSLNKDANLGNLFVGKLTNIALPSKPDEKLKVFFRTNAISDLWIAVTWQGSSASS
jgi:hypothetical protein